MKSRGIAAAVTLGAVICAGGAVTWLLLAPRPDAPPRRAAGPDTEPTSIFEPAADAPSMASSALPAPSAVEAQGVPTSLPPYTGPTRDRARANQLREALTALVASKHGDEDGVMPSAVGAGNQAGAALGRYVDSVMQEQFVPLAGSCYEALLAEQPKAQGSVNLDFSIVGDRSVGGVVLDVEVRLGPGLEGGGFETCLRESMYSVVFDAPPGEDGTVSVTQSFELSP